MYEYKYIYTDNNPMNNLNGAIHYDYVWTITREKLLIHNIISMVLVQTSALQLLI